MGRHSARDRVRRQKHARRGAPLAAASACQTAAWWRTSQLVDALFGSLGEETKAHAHQACAASLLVLDDLGHVVGDRGFVCLHNVIAARQEHERATIFTLNEPLVAFCKRHWAIGSALTRGTIPVPFIQTYAQRTSGRQQPVIESQPRQDNHRPAPARRTVP